MERLGLIVTILATVTVAMLIVMAGSIIFLVQNPPPADKYESFTLDPVSDLNYRISPDTRTAGPCLYHYRSAHPEPGDADRVFKTVTGAGMAGVYLDWTGFEATDDALTAWGDLVENVARRLHPLFVAAQFSGPLTGIWTSAGTFVPEQCPAAHFESFTHIFTDDDRVALLVRDAPLVTLGLPVGEGSAREHQDKVSEWRKKDLFGNKLASYAAVKISLA